MLWRLRVLGLAVSSYIRCRKDIRIESQGTLKSIRFVSKYVRKLQTLIVFSRVFNYAQTAIERFPAKCA